MKCACAIMSSVASPTDIFSLYLLNGTIFGEGEVADRRICVVTFSTTFA